MENLEGWTEIEDNAYWKPKSPGDEIQGVVISKFEGVTIETKENNQIKLPEHTTLKNKLKSVKVGNLIKVVFEKEVPATEKTKAYFMYRVFTKSIN